MQQSSVFDDLAKVMVGAMGMAQGMGQEAQGFLRSQAERFVAEMDLRAGTSSRRSSKSPPKRAPKTKLCVTGSRPSKPNCNSAEPTALVTLS